MKFILKDTFNSRDISSHRTLLAAVKAQAKHSRAVRKSNGASSYIPKKIVQIVDGEETPVDEYALMECEQAI